MSFAVTVARYLPRSFKEMIHRHRGLHTISTSVYGALAGSAPHAIPEGPLAGIRLVPSAHISHAHLLGTYEPEMQAALDRLIEPGMVCYDVGASIGYFTLQMSRKAKHVYAFEPSPTALGVMSQQLRINPHENITVIASPLSERQQTVRFYVTHTAYGSRISATARDWPMLPLEAITLDDFCRSHPHPDLIKLDVEAAELEVLRGASQLLLHRHPVICCELHSAELARQVAHLLTGFGYRLTTITGEAFQPPTAPTMIGELQIIGRAAGE